MKPISITMDGKPLFAKAEEATLPWERMRGLLGIEALDAQYALVFRRCPRIHCKGMKIPIDVASLDKRGTVLDARRVNPGEMGPALKGCSTVIEMRAGRAAELGIEQGRQISLKRK